MEFKVREMECVAYRTGTLNQLGSVVSVEYANGARILASFPEQSHANAFVDWLLEHCPNMRKTANCLRPGDF